MELEINSEKYKYFYNGNLLKQCPNLCNYDIVSDDISNLDKYKENCKEYKKKIEDSKGNVCATLAIIFYIGELFVYYGHDLLEELADLPILLSLYLFLPFVLLVFFIGLFFGGIQFIVLYLIVPKFICRWVTKLFVKKPLPPNKMLEVEKYNSDVEKYNTMLNKYRELYEGIEKADYKIDVFGKECVSILVLKLVEYAKKKNDEIRKHNIKQSRDFWFKLNPYDFEKEVALWYEKNGYKAIVTAKSGDGGIDIILQRNGERMYVQCKRFTTSKVDRPTLNALYGVMCADNVRKGIVACLLGATDEAKAFAKKVGIEIITIDELCPEADLFHQLDLKNEINIEPVKNNDYWCLIGNIYMQTGCYQIEETALKRISAWENSASYHALMYRGLYFIIKLVDDKFEDIESWLNKKPQIDYENLYYSPQKYRKKKSRYYKNYYHCM